MPRKTKDQIEKENLEKEDSKKVTKSTKSAIKKTTTRSTTTKKAVEKEAGTTKKTTSKSASAKKIAAKKSASAKEITSKSASSQKAKKSTAKKALATKTRATTRKKALPIVEYYDLPYRYNQTVVKLLAQTPTNLFVYWDISDDDRENYKKNYGENFFEETKPVLIIHNKTLNYSFEVDINDFANSWYIHVNDSKCDYHIELGRRPIPSVSHIDTDYIYVSSSNDIESPNDRILFNIDENKVYYRNVKTNITSTKSISLIKNMGKIYNIYDLYKAVYREELQDNMLEDFSSSTFK